jgi:hypothetical protein
MSNPTAFLSTLAESAAAIVAIVGGFLVSRLAALFAGGLAAVLGYMFWYVRTLNQPITPDGSST